MLWVCSRSMPSPGWGKVGREGRENPAPALQRQGAGLTESTRALCAWKEGAKSVRCCLVLKALLGSHPGDGSMRSRGVPCSTRCLFVLATGWRWGWIPASGSGVVRRGSARRGPCPRAGGCLPVWSAQPPQCKCAQNPLKHGSGQGTGGVCRGTGWWGQKVAPAHVGMCGCGQGVWVRTPNCWHPWGHIPGWHPCLAAAGFSLT